MNLLLVEPSHYLFDAHLAQHPGLVKRIKRAGEAGAALCRCPREDVVILLGKKDEDIPYRNEIVWIYYNLPLYFWE